MLFGTWKLPQDVFNSRRFYKPFQELPLVVPKPAPGTPRRSDGHPLDERRPGSGNSRPFWSSAASELMHVHQGIGSMSSNRRLGADCGRRFRGLAEACRRRLPCRPRVVGDGSWR